MPAVEVQSVAMSSACPALSAAPTQHSHTSRLRRIGPGVKSGRRLRGHVMVPALSALGLCTAPAMKTGEHHT